MTNELSPILESAEAYFRRVAGHVDPSRPELAPEDHQEAKDLEARIFHAGGALVSSGNNPLVGDEDRKDLKISLRRMSAALRLLGYQQWDAHVK